MRWLGKDYDGEGVTIAVIDSGIDKDDPRLSECAIEGWAIDLGATGHALIKPDFSDENGHGTEIAVAVHKTAPKAKLLAIKIMGKRLRTSAELMAAGIETASKSGAQIINLSLGTPNMGKALLLRDCCGNAVEGGALVLAAAHPKGDRAYPADLPETIGVAAHPDCPLGKVFYFDPGRFPRKQWGALTGKFLTHGHARSQNTDKDRYRGSGIATSYLSGHAACLREAMPHASAASLVEKLKWRSLIPVPEIGYS